MKYLFALLFVTTAMIGCATSTGPGVHTDRVAASSSRLTYDFSTILGSLYHDDFDATQGVSVNGSSRVTQWANQAGDGDAYPGVVESNRRTQSQDKPVYSATSFSGQPGVTADGLEEQLGATLSSPIASGKRPYMWVVIYGANPNSNEDFFASLHDTQNGDFPVSLIEAAITVDGSHVWEEWRGDDSDPSCSSTCGFSQILAGSPSSAKHLVEVGFTSNGTAAMVVDGVAYDSDTAGAASLDMDGLWIFGSPESSQGLEVTVARVIVAGDQPSAQQLTDMRADLSDQYGLGF